MQQTEEVIEPTCRRCGFENDIGCEVDGDLPCTQCGATLFHETVVEYIDSCPLCNASYESGKPFFFKSDASGLTHWLCHPCLVSPRGMFYQEFEMAEETARPAPACRLCGGRSKLLVITHASNDGVFICEHCSSTQAGAQMLKEHYEAET